MTSQVRDTKKFRKDRRICAWCAPHFRAKIEGRSSDHTRCDDFSCGCHCQDGRAVN